MSSNGVILSEYYIAENTASKQLLRLVLITRGTLYAAESEQSHLEQTGHRSATLTCSRYEYKE